MTKKTGSKMVPPDMAAKGDKLTGYGEEAAIGIDMRSFRGSVRGLDQAARYDDSRRLVLRHRPVRLRRRR